MDAHGHLLVPVLSGPAPGHHHLVLRHTVQLFARAGGGPIGSALASPCVGPGDERQYEDRGLHLHLAGGGLLLGLGIGVAVYRLLRQLRRPRWTIFRKGQLISAAAYSLGHGGNDAQKTMGIIAGLLSSAGYPGPEFHIPGGWCSHARRR